MGSNDDRVLSAKSSLPFHHQRDILLGLLPLTQELEKSLFTPSKLVPELIVRNLDNSLKFWVDTLGFCVAYARFEEKFVYLDLGGAQLMLEELNGIKGQWLTAALEPPLGRGVNFQISVPAVAPILEQVNLAGYTLFRECQDSWYVTGAGKVGQREFVVQDPDGYLVRLTEQIGEQIEV